MAPMNDNNDEEDFLNRLRKWLTRWLTKLIKWRQCVDNQRPPLGEYWYRIQTPYRYSTFDPDRWTDIAMSNETFCDFFFVIMIGEQLYGVWLVQEFFTSIR